jgi:hypothetical protein
MTKSNAQPAKPRRRGAPPQPDQTQPAQAQPVTAASSGDAPILLQIPQLTGAPAASPPQAEREFGEISAGVMASSFTADATAAAAITAEATIDSASETAERPSATGSQNSSLADNDLGEQPDSAPAGTGDKPSSSEVRERRRKRRERQAPEKSAWGTASGRITIAGGVVVVGIVLTALLIPNGGDVEPTGAWEPDGLQIGDGAEAEVGLDNTTTGIASTTDPAGEGAFAQPAQAANANPDFRPYLPVEEQVAATSSNSEKGESQGGVAQVQTSYGQPPAPKTAYHQGPAEAYPTPEFNASRSNHDAQHAAHTQAVPTHVADARSGAEQVSRSPGTYVNDRPRVDNTANDTRRGTNQFARMQPPNNRYVPEADQQRFGANPPHLPPAAPAPAAPKAGHDPAGNTFPNPYPYNQAPPYPSQ